MQAWMETMNPGESHKQLQKSVGTWDATTKIWMDPSAPPMETGGVSEIKSVLGGRFILQQHTGEMLVPDMKTGAMNKTPMEGLGLFGYDNYQKMYMGCWADTMGTQLLSMKGALSPDGKTMTMYGEMDEPMLGVRGRYVKYVTKFVDDNTQVFTIYDLHAGDNYRVVEVEYKRRK